MVCLLSQLCLYVTVAAVWSRLKDTVDGHVICLDPTEGCGLRGVKIKASEAAAYLG